MIVETIVVIIGLIILSHGIGWWVKKILELRIQGRKEVIHQIFSLVRETYDYLTEEVEDK